MENKNLIEIAFAKITHESMKNISSKKSANRIELVFMDDSTENGIGMSSFQNDRIKEYVQSGDSRIVMARASMDAVTTLNPDEEQLYKGIYVPNEGIKEPMAIGFYIDRKGDSSVEYEAELYMFSCIPYYSDAKKGIHMKIEQETQMIIAKNVPVPESVEKAWQSWMRVMWGMNWKIRYGTEPETD